ARGFHKRAVTVAQQHGNVVGGGVGDHQILGGGGDSVDAVRHGVAQGSGGNRDWAGLRLWQKERRIRGGYKVAATLVEQNADAVVVLVGHGDIRKAVAIEVAGGERYRIIADGERGLRKRCRSGESGKGSGCAAAAAQAARKQREGNRKAVADEECGRLAVLRAHQDLPAALYQAESVRKICGGAGKGQKKCGVATTEEGKAGDAGESLGAEELAENGERIRQVFRLL